MTPLRQRVCAVLHIYGERPQSVVEAICLTLVFGNDRVVMCDDQDNASVSTAKQGEINRIYIM